MTDTLDKTLRDVQERGLKLRGIGVPWFTAESWPRLLAIAADRADLPDTFEGFERRAGERFDRHVAAGQPLEKVLVVVDQLAAWCRELGVSVDARARSVFAAVMLARQASQAGHG